MAINLSPEPIIVTADIIRTANPLQPEAQGMLICGREILMVGSLEECEAASAERFVKAPEVISFPGQTVVPGFVDPHAHPVSMGQFLTWVDCSPGQAGSIDEMVGLLTEAARRAEPGVTIRGYGYEQRNLREKRHPSCDELDQASTSQEIYLMNASGHSVIVNHYALEKYGITDTTPDPDGGAFVRDEAGRLTGEIVDAACNVLTGPMGVKVGAHGPNFHLPETDEHLNSYLEAAQSVFLRNGVTSIGDAQVSSREFGTYQRLRVSGKLRARFSLYLLSHMLDSVLEVGLKSGFGDEILEVAGIKLYVDGSLGGWTAYFPDGYPGDPCRTGQLYHDPTEYDGLVRRAHLAGLQTASHAQSPDAVGMVITAVRNAQQVDGVQQRHRVEHCGLPALEQISEMRALGMLPVNQPMHGHNWGEGVVEAIGDDGERFNPLGDFLRADLPITLSSDAPVAYPNPLQAIDAAVTRETRSGLTLGSEDLRVSPEAALQGHTLHGARALNRENSVGSLEAGKLADFVVLAGDPFGRGRIRDIEVEETWVAGVREYHRNENRA
ncbi:amidohydrolase [Leucobacter sp. L43]|uniref:amidohydrolase n=1 Tax=Leucobacter sp. L43 TaxID=2798040 RepID=UPI0019072A27|nr:amidohydrolase [Leucobacter sp. L43]